MGLLGVRERTWLPLDDGERLFRPWCANLVVSAASAKG